VNQRRKISQVKAGKLATVEFVSAYGVALAKRDAAPSRPTLC
jgi:hypothetical protein